MLKPEQVPEVVWRVAMMTYHREIRRHPEQAWQLSIAAALTTWPGMARERIGKGYKWPLTEEYTEVIILPLTQEASDGK